MTKTTQDPDDGERPEGDSLREAGPEPATPQPQGNLVDFTQLAGEDPVPERRPGHWDLVIPKKGEKVFVGFVTSSAADVDTHFLNTAEPNRHFGFVQCNGPGCVLCRAGLKTERKLLLPVWDFDKGIVAVLPVSWAHRPGSLRTKLLPILTRLKAGGDPPVLGITRLSDSEFDVRELPSGAEDIDLGQVSFTLDALNRGELDLSDAQPKYDNEYLAALPEIARRLRFAG